MLNVQDFDETKIDWKPLPGPDGSPADHIGCSILHVDNEAKIVDVLFKFSANEKIVNHRHTSDFNTFVVKGEHHIYDLEGNSKEVQALLESARKRREKGGESDQLIDDMAARWGLSAIRVRVAGPEAQQRVPAETP